MTVGTLPPQKGPISSVQSPISAWLLPALRSTIGSKFIVAITGVMLIGFLIAHLAGNLLIFKGQDALNHYAKALSDLGPMLWAMRIGLLTVFVIHIYLALKLKARNVAARPEKYQYEATVQATITSRTMVLTGLLILAFVVYHIAHYTLGLVHTQNGTNLRDLRDSLGRHDVYSMVIAGFSNWWVTLSYIAAQLILGMHLSHGTSSVFQTLGWNSPRYWPIIRFLAIVFTVLLIAGNISIPMAVWLGMVK